MYSNVYSFEKFKLLNTKGVKRHQIPEYYYIIVQITDSVTENYLSHHENRNLYLTEKYAIKYKIMVRNSMHNLNNMASSAVYNYSGLVLVIQNDFKRQFICMMFNNGIYVKNMYTHTVAGIS